ncbi:hypothetical protein Tco_1390045, partial [Tanacetum coccineum]
FKEKVLLVQARAEGKELDEEQLTFLTDPGVVDGQSAQTITHNAAFQIDDLDAYDSVVMISLQLKWFLWPISQVVIQMFLLRESKSTDKEIVLENKNKELENIVSLGYQNPFYLKRAQRIKPILYDCNMLSKTHDVLFVVDDEETLILAEESRLKMVEKQNDPIMKKEKIKITPINYSELNKLAEDFGKRFVPQQELSAKQKFWLQSSEREL